METYIMPSIAIFCCVMAYAFKNAIKVDRVHDFIPLGCAVLGIALSVGFMGFTLDNLAIGAVSGFAATGLWEQITHIMPNKVVANHAKE